MAAIVRLCYHRRVLGVVILMYMFVTLYCLFKLTQENMTIKFTRTSGVEMRTEILNLNLISPQIHEVEIWGKASVGLYLWKHILEGPDPSPKGGMVQTESMKINSTFLTYRTGPGLVPGTAPRNVSYLVLALNGRSSDKVKDAKVWLDSLPAFENLKKVVILMLGNEECDNTWMMPYMKSRGGPVHACFITYDCPCVDEQEFFQWPLGVAVYRNFPNVNPQHIDSDTTRPYLCNFLGTIYKNSSREKLANVIESKDSILEICLLSKRESWLPYETQKSLQSYINALLQSDLTLNPVGKNTECYRLYEALSLGSVPVVEDIMTPGLCGPSPLRLLKAHKAPLIFIKDWKDLPLLIEKESMLTIKAKVFRRASILQWYKLFKVAMAERFLRVLSQ